MSTEKTLIFFNIIEFWYNCIGWKYNEIPDIFIKLRIPLYIHIPLKNTKILNVQILNKFRNNKYRFHKNVDFRIYGPFDKIWTRT